MTCVQENPGNYEIEFIFIIKCYIFSHVYFSHDVCYGENSGEWGLHFRMNKKRRREWIIQFFISQITLKLHVVH